MGVLYVTVLLYQHGSGSSANGAYKPPYTGHRTPESAGEPATANQKLHTRKQRRVKTSLLVVVVAVVVGGYGA